MLQFDKFTPAGVTDGAPVFVLLHGRGADRRDLLGLQPALPPGSMLITPEAPHPGTPWGYGPGWAWYRLQSPGQPEPESFEQSQQRLHEFLTALPSLLPVKPGPVILGGFSQGGVMSLAYALRNPGAVPSIINFSGFLADHPTVVASADRVQGTRIFWGHGTEDPAIPFALAQVGRERLRQAGADLTAKDYPMGHWIDHAELDDVLGWLGLGE